MNRFLKLSYYAAITIGSLVVTTGDVFPLEQPQAAESRCTCICGSTCDQFTCPTATIKTSALVVALKALNKMPIDPDKDFPPGIATFTDGQREEYRREFAKNISCVFGCPVGWKLALSAASPTNPVLGYTEPSIGQLFAKMNICSSEVRIRNDFAVGAAHEVDCIIRVSNEAINSATTPEQIIENIDAVFPYLELPALYVETLAQLAGPGAPFFGNSLLTPLNGVARLGVLGKAIPVPGSRTTAKWIQTLMLVTGTETITTTNGPISRPFNNANYIEFALTLIRLLNKNGIRVKKGDLLSLGNLTGVNLFNPDELEIEATYTNLDPQGPVAMKIIVDNSNGLCIGSSAACPPPTPPVNSIFYFISQKYCSTK